MPAVLLDAGLKVAQVPGWQARGRRDMGRVQGVMIHHTAGPAEGNMPSLQTLVDGRGGAKPLPGPLAQLGLGRDGTWYVIAAGLANHAGDGNWLGVSAGNTHFIGIEVENTGQPDDMPWPEVQMTALCQGVAALLRHAGRSADWCCGHREYAPHRKIDPRWDVARFRSQVARVLAGGVQPLAPIPAVERDVPDGAEPRATLRRGSDGPLVHALQTALGIQADGMFGAITEAAVRAFQRQHQLVPDGIVGPRTWALLPR